MKHRIRLRAISKLPEGTLDGVRRLPRIQADAILHKAQGAGYEKHDSGHDSHPEDGNKKAGLEHVAHFVVARVIRDQRYGGPTAEAAGRPKR